MSIIENAIVTHSYKINIEQLKELIATDLDVDPANIKISPINEDTSGVRSSYSNIEFMGLNITYTEPC